MCPSADVVHTGGVHTAGVAEVITEAAGMTGEGVITEAEGMTGEEAITGVEDTNIGVRVESWALSCGT